MPPTPLRVLLTEDDLQRAATLETYLRAAGHEVIRVEACSDAALQAARRVRPDLVVLGSPLRGPFDGVIFTAVLQNCELGTVPVLLVADPAELLALVRPGPGVAVAK